MNFLNSICEWIWARREGIVLLSTVLLLLFAAVGTASVFYAAQSLQLQYRQYQEEYFNRQQGAVSLAWHTIADANQKIVEIGQSDAILFLIKNFRLEGKITLNRSVLTLYNAPDERFYLNLHRSNLCGTNFYIHITTTGSISLTNSLVRSSKIAGQLIDLVAMGADFDHALFSQVRMPKSNFIAANLNSATIYGGSFEKADFQGADLRSLRTFRGTQGAGTAYNDSNFYAGYIDYSSPIDFPPIFTSASADYFKQPDTSDDEAIRLVDFRGARFLNTDIRGADLSNTTVTQSQVDEACADQRTKLPSGILVHRTCVPESWIKEHRDVIQKATYEGRIKDLADCDRAAADPSWR